MTNPQQFHSLSDTLRSRYKPAEYPGVALPLYLLRRLGVDVQGDISAQVSALSGDAQQVLEELSLSKVLKRLEQGSLLPHVTAKATSWDVSASLGDTQETLTGMFASAEDGAHYTPHEVNVLAARLLLEPLTYHGGRDRPERLSVYDPTAGVGGMLSTFAAEAGGLGIQADLYGQELNPQSAALARADLLVRGQPISNMQCGNTLAADLHAGREFDYIVSNPPFGVDWSADMAAVKAAPDRFGCHLPPKSDGAMLFVMHALSKLRDTGSAAFITSGSPLFRGNPGSGDAEIRRWLLEQELVECIVQLPGDLFINTGIQTYLWIMRMQKRDDLRRRVRLIDASGAGEKLLRKSEGNRRVRLTDEEVNTICDLNSAGGGSGDPGSESQPIRSVTVRLRDMGSRRITVRLPQLDADGKPIFEKDTEDVPLTEDVQAYFEREVLSYQPHARLSTAAAHCDHKDGRPGKVGYEIKFGVHFVRNYAGQWLGKRVPAIPNARQTQERFSPEPEPILTPAVSDRLARARATTGGHQRLCVLAARDVAVTDADRAAVSAAAAELGVEL